MLLKFNGRPPFFFLFFFLVYIYDAASNLVAARVEFLARVLPAGAAAVLTERPF